jgi:hypothetical protein
LLPIVNWYRLAKSPSITNAMVLVKNAFANRSQLVADTETVIRDTLPMAYNCKLIQMGKRLKRLIILHWYWHWYWFKILPVTISHHWHQILRLVQWHFMIGYQLETNPNGWKPINFKYIGISINQKNYKLESDTTVPVY